MGTFLSWNCRGLRSKLQDIKDIINKFHPICIGLQETFLSSNIPLKLRGYNSVRKDTIHGTGGVCVLTSNLYPSTVLALRTTLQAVAVQVHARKLVTVCSIYLPPHDLINQHDLDNLMDQLPAPFLLFGDFNGHSILWGSDSTNSRGRQIERFISDNCLCLLNSDEKTYFHEPTRTFHSLDLAICSPDILPLLNFIVGSDLHDSDHFPLIVSYTETDFKQCPPRYVFQRADWAAFMQQAVISENMVSMADITHAIQSVVDCLLKAANNTIPKSSPRMRKFRRPWWNEACRDSYREQKKRWNIFRRYPTSENLIAFKRARANARRIRRRSQRESWCRFISSITSFTSSKLLWKKVKAANGVYKDFSFPVLNTGNGVMSSPLDVANTLGEAFAKVSAADNYMPAFIMAKNRAERKSLRFTTRNSYSYNSEFRMNELLTALSKARDTSPGPDGITQILNVLPPSVKGTLYVDDLQISSQGSDMRVIERQLQVAVNRLVDWCDGNGHTISPEKSRCVHFCRKRGIHLDPLIHIRNANIPVVNEVKFLGIIFDLRVKYLPSYESIPNDGYPEEPSWVPIFDKRFPKPKKTPLSLQ
ncbi:uncharacterized protein LOC129969057 [Argiope bruennichi]|uniref:uncharacterized protein LOC129969057 n=1 Tax=Argiope bruennichi TaxID=94029 RepID=UPI002493F500|nr:uncharacterized protein LOC129969057 [Argiope bruennichi]